MIRPRSRCAFVIPFLVFGVLLAGCDWTQSRFGPDHTGFNAVETVINPGNVSDLQMRWSQRVGDAHTIENPPTIANGVLYLVADKLYAFDARSGSARWSTSVGGKPHFSSPAVANGVVYVNGDDELHTFDAATGVPLWSAAVEAEGSPTVANGVVYVTSDRVYAFDAASGATLWSAFVLGHGLPTVANGVVYVAGGDRLYAFDAKTGAKIWIRRLAEGSLYGVAAVANGVIYVGGDKLRVYNATTGALLWTATTYGGSPAVANGVVYVGGDRLYAFDATTGALLWSSVLAAGFVYGSPTVANGVVYVSGDKLFAYNATTGARIWSPPGHVRSDPVVANGIVYAAVDGALQAYGLLNASPQLVISPAAPADYVFGDPNATAKTFTVTNIGSTPLGPIADSLTGPDGPHFRLTSDACAGTSLAGGASCTVTASFAPTRSGSFTAWLTSTATGAGTVRARLAGTAQLLTVSPSPKEFGDVFVGSTSTVVFTVTNLSVASIGPITAAVNTWGEFNVAADTCSGRIIAAGTACNIAVKFAPTTTGNYDGTLNAQAPDHQAEASFTARALARLAISPAAAVFGAVQVGARASATFTVTNVSPSAVGPITDAIDPGFNSVWYTITLDLCAGRTLAPGTTCTIVVTLAPLGLDYAVSQLRVAAPLGGTRTADLIGAGM